VKIAVAASPDVAIPTLEYLQSSSHNLALVISRPDSQVGRGREFAPTSVSSWALLNRIELYRPSKVTDFDERLREFDLVITIGYGLILPQYLLDQPKYGFINLHFSLLPKLRGAAPVQRAIINGLTETGVTVFKLNAGMDTGPIYVQERFPIAAEVTAGELLIELAKLGPNLIANTLTMIETGVEPTEQNHNLASTAPKLSKLESQITWDNSATQIVNQINGYSPNPGATATFRGDVIKINRARISDFQLSVGEIVLASGKVLVGTSDLAVELIEVTPAGKRTMSAVAWANGARFSAGEMIE